MNEMLDYLDLLVSSSNVPILLGLTSIILALFTYKESARSNMLQHLPIIYIEFDVEDDQISAQNVGSSMALDITLSTYRTALIDSQTQQAGRSIVKFIPVKSLPPNQHALFNEKELGITEGMGIASYIPFSKSTRNTYLVLKFKDLTGRKYSSVIKCHEGKVIIQKYPQMYSMLATNTYISRIKISYYNIIDMIKVLYFQLKGYKNSL